MRIRSWMAVGLLAISAAACSAGAEPVQRQAAPAPAPPRAGAPPRLVFFMNPNGVPCQIQDRVLREMGPELGARAALVVYRTFGALILRKGMLFAGM